MVLLFYELLVNSAFFSGDSDVRNNVSATETSFLKIMVKVLVVLVEKRLKLVSSKHNFLLVWE